MEGQKEANIHRSCTDFQKAVSVERSLGLVGLEFSMVAVLLTEDPFIGKPVPEGDIQGIRFWKSCRSVHSQSLEIWWCPWEHHRVHVHWYSWMNAWQKNVSCKCENGPKRRKPDQGKRCLEGEQEITPHHWIQCAFQGVSWESLP